MLQILTTLHHSLIFAERSSRYPGRLQRSPYAENLSAVQEDVTDIPALYRDKEKPRSTPIGPTSNEAWIQWIYEMAGRHGKPMFELRLSKIDHPRAGLDLFTTASCDTVHPGFKMFMAERVLRLDKEGPVAQQEKHPNLVALRGPQYDPAYLPIERARVRSSSL